MKTTYLLPDRATQPDTRLLYMAPADTTGYYMRPRSKGRVHFVRSGRERSPEFNGAYFGRRR